MAELSLACKHLRGASDVARALEGRELTELRSLVLSSNLLKEDPLSQEQAQAMTGVTKALLGFNQLPIFPRSVFNLEMLIALHLNNNQIGHLPPELGRLTRLATLVLSHNALSCLPPEIGNLKQLVHLDVANNMLESVPSSVCWLLSLKILVLSDNKLKALPRDMDRLKALEGLRLAGNWKNAVWAENRSGKAAVQDLLALIVAPYACHRALYYVLAIHRFRGDECPSFSRIPRDVLRFVFAPILAASWPKSRYGKTACFSSFNK